MVDIEVNLPLVSTEVTYLKLTGTNVKAGMEAGVRT